jgi:hypothetical protein
LNYKMDWLSSFSFSQTYPFITQTKPLYLFEPIK